MKLILFAIGVLTLVVILLTTTKHGWRIFSRTYAPSAANHAKLVHSLRMHVYVLSHEIGSRNFDNYRQLNKAADYIAQKLKAAGYNITLQNYDTDGKDVKNIIALKLGTTKPTEIVVIGAHYDSCYNPGADDNASGVAALIELAKLITNYATAKSIEFVAFVNEEPPFFHTDKMGSRVFTKQARESGKNIKAGLVLDMVGYYSDAVNSQHYPRPLGIFYPNKANFIAIVGNAASRQLAADVTASFKQHANFPIEKLVFGNIPGVDFSDHWSFWQEGYPAIMITDTAFYRNTHYHQQSDTYETLNYDSMCEVVKGLNKVIIDLAK